MIEVLKGPAEEALFKAATNGDLATLKLLVDEKVNLEAKDDTVSAALPADTSPLAAPLPSALATRRP